eukprot:scaffold195451_cov19-Tisochrysis_lutea.AAC.1
MELNEVNTPADLHELRTHFPPPPRLHIAVGIGRRVPQGHPRGCGSRAAADAHGYGWLGGEVAAGVTIVQGCIVEGRVVAAHHGARHGGIRLVMVHARWEAAVVVAGVAV